MPGRTTTAEACALSRAPSQSADTAMLVFSAIGVERATCALRLAAAVLRSWPTQDNGRWSVQMALTAEGATARRLNAEGARDAIDTGIALVATDDLDVVAYATARRELEVRPLPWDRTYVRLSTRDGLPLGAERASEAVGVDARPANELPCDTGTHKTTTPGARTSSQRIIFDASDPTARELAERIVALAGIGTVAVGLDTLDLDAALRAGDDLAYVVSVPRSDRDGCAAFATLTERAPWLAPESITPLIDTRAYLISPRTPEP